MSSETCSNVVLEEMKIKNPKLILVAMTPDCANGDMMKDLVKENLKSIESKGAKVAELMIDSKSCDTLANELKVEACPTLVFYKEGKEVRRFVPSGESKEDVAKKLIEEF